MQGDSKAQRGCPKKNDWAEFISMQGCIEMNYEMGNMEKDESMTVSWKSMCKGPVAKRNMWHIGRHEKSQG